MSTWLGMQRGDGRLLVALLITSVGVCWHAAWLPVGLFLLTLLFVGLAWQRANRRFERILTRNQRLRESVHELTREQGRFFGSIAADLETPLTVVQRETERLLRCEDAVVVRSAAESIADEVGHLAALVESFLHLPRLSVREGAARHESVFVSDLVVAAVGRCRALSNKLGVRVVTLVAKPDNGDRSAAVMGDSLLLRVMIEILLRNVVRLAHRGAQVEVSTSADAHTVGVSVRDQGRGILVEQRESPSDWFFDGAGRPAGRSGTGLGIAKRIVDHHHGSMVLRETPDRGREIEILLERHWPT